MSIRFLAMPVNKVSRRGLLNAFLVREHDGFTLIVTTITRSAKAILEAASGLGAPIVRIALTHAHADLVGSLDALAAALPGVEVLSTERDARFLSGDNSLDPDELRTNLRGGYPQVRTRPTGEL